MLDKHNPNPRQESMPQVRFTGQGIFVNGAWIDGDAITAWVRFSADAGFVAKVDSALSQAHDRIDEDSRAQSVGLFDAITNLIEIAGGSVL